MPVKSLDQLVNSYEPTDPFFEAAYVDKDEQREKPITHRYVHGGFIGTDTRFSFYFPGSCDSRFFHFLDGGYGGNEYTSMTRGYLRYAASRGGFFIESNQGHIGAEPCAKGGNDASIYAYRASAESARFAQYLATGIYGSPPAHGYLFGSSGGGHRTRCALEYCEDDVWDAGTASVIGSQGTMLNYSAMLNARRLLGERFNDVVDAVEPGGSGDPFHGLTIEQREALADLYALGFPRGAERSVPEGLNASVLFWSWNAEVLREREPEYFQAFWEQPGYAGADGLVNDDIINIKTTVTKVVNRQEAMTYGLGGFSALFMGGAPDQRIGIEVDGEIKCPEGARITINSGQAAGRELFVGNAKDGLFIGSAIGEAQTLLFKGVEIGDEVHIDNRDFLAYCYYYRHHLAEPADLPRLFIDGCPIHPQHPRVDSTSEDTVIFGPLDLTGAIRRPLFLIQHSHDTSGWPDAGVTYAEDVAKHLGDSAEDQFRFWWLHQAEHVPGSIIPATSRPAPSTRLIDYNGAHEAALDAMVAWIEDAVVPPASTLYTWEDKGLGLPKRAGRRLGIQPVATLTANGSARIEVCVGEEVEFEVDVEAPPNAGSIVEIAWDLEGDGSWPVVDKQSSPVPTLRAGQKRGFSKPGTYFPAVRVASHMSGDPSDPHSRIMNLGRCRVIVH